MAAIGNESIPGLHPDLYNRVLEFLPPEEILAKAPLVSRGWNELRDQRVRDAARRCLVEQAQFYSHYPRWVSGIFQTYSISFGELPFLPVENQSLSPSEPNFSRFERITAPIMKWRFGSRAGIVFSIRSKESAGLRRIGSISFHKNYADGGEGSVRIVRNQSGTFSRLFTPINCEQLTQLLEGKHPEYEINRSKET